MNLHHSHHDWTTIKNTEAYSNWKNDFGSRSCDVIHIRGNFNGDINDLVHHFTPSRRKDDSIPNDSFSYVVWERLRPTTTHTKHNKKSIQTQITTQRFQDKNQQDNGIVWEMSIKWPERAGISVRSDPHGYLQQFYDVTNAEIR